MKLTRRHMIAVTASALAAAGISSECAAACAIDRHPTGSISGPPEYIPGAPVRTSFFSDQGDGQRIKLFGRVLSTTCEPLGGAKLDFWHTDKAGKYDEGHRFRGIQYTDRGGNFTLETVMPGQYYGARHVHFLVATRLKDRSQPLFLSSGIFLPTAEEYAAAKPEGDAEFLSQATLRSVGGVLMVPCDIILETT